MRTNLIPLAVVLSAVAFCGCGKKEEVAPTPAPAAQAPAEAPAPVATAAAAPRAAALPDTRLTESQNALKAREYEKAADALLALRRTQLNEQQAAAAAAQMRQLQGSLAQAIANGDPRARAIADRLAQSAMTR